METEHARLNHGPLSADFEFTHENFINCIDEIFEMQESTYVDGYTTELRIKEIFETNFGIRDHSPDGYTKSLSPLVTYNPITDVNAASGLKQEFKRLIDMKAPVRTGMSIIDLLSLDSTVYNELISAVEDYNNESNNLNDVSLDDLKDELDKE